MNDSFEQNERLATRLTGGADWPSHLSRDKLAASRANTYGTRGNPGAVFHEREEIDLLDERPTRDTGLKPGATFSNQNRRTEGAAANAQNLGDTFGAGQASLGGRQKINIDENEDTFHNQNEFKKIMDRGQRLKERMNEAMGLDTWEKLHGPNEVPKKYVAPFLQNEGEKGVAKAKETPEEQLDRIYSMEIDENLGNTGAHQQLDGAKMTTSAPSNEIKYGGTGGNLTDMKFIRLKIKTLRITDEDLLRDLIDQKFSLTVAVPLPDIYNKVVQDQFIKLSNYDIVSFNEFEFTSLTLYNFKVSEETFNQLAQANLQCMIDGAGVHGEMSMNKLLLSSDFKLKFTVPLIKSVQKDAKEARKERRAKEAAEAKQKGKKVKKEGIPTQRKEEPLVENTDAGSLQIEINLQRGDTEEELERNYQIKLQQNEEMRKHEKELELLEKRKRAVMTLEEQPTFAQLYLNIDKLGPGGIIIDREGYEVPLAQQIQLQIHEATQSKAKPYLQNDESDDLSRKDGEGENETSGEAEKKDNLESKQLQLPKRNLYVQYKAFPTLEKLSSSVEWNNALPMFNFRSQFPVLMTPQVIDKLEEFTFVVEVWDQVSPGRDDLVGLVKIPLASFCYNLKTTEDDIFSLNFLADQHNLYPMVIADEALPIYSPRYGGNVGQLKVLLAFGTPMQVTRQIQREQEFEKSKQQALLAEERTRMQTKLMTQIQSIPVATQSKDNEQEEKEKKEAEEAEAMAKNPLAAFLSPSKNGVSGDFGGRFANALRQSLQMSNGKKDYDLRQNTYLHAMRKMFEEFRCTLDLDDFTSEELFKTEDKAFDGSVHKDDFIYQFLDRESFSLTRGEVSNICQLMLNITGLSVNTSNQIDLDELQFSYKSYQKYYELVEARVVDLLEKFKLSISKKIQTEEEILDLVERIHNLAIDSKITLTDLRQELDDNNGVVIRDALYDQLASYFDLDRSGQVYIASFCSYLRDSTISHFNFFKVNAGVLASQIIDYVRNCIAAKADYLSNLEKEFKEEIYWKTSSKANRGANKSMDLSKSIIDAGDDAVNVDLTGEQKPAEEGDDEEKTPPIDLLLNERINAKLFQFKLKRQGVALSLWEVFTIFEHLNMRMAKMFYEPQRYHFILYEHFHTLITGQDYRGSVEAVLEERRKVEEARIEAEQAEIKRLEEVEEKKKKKRRYKKAGADGDALNDIERGSSSSGLFSLGDKNLNSDEEDSSNLGGSSLASGKEYGNANKRDARQRRKDDKKPYDQVKHIFDINVKELINIPVLARFIREAKDYENAQLPHELRKQDTQNSIDTGSKRESALSSSTQNNYIQNVAVKYSFPLDEDEILESDYIRRTAFSTSKDKGKSDRNSTVPDPQTSQTYDYTVSMNTVHTYLLSREDPINNLLLGQAMTLTKNQNSQLFNISVALYQDNREFVIGNAQLPLEDLSDLVKDYDEMSGSYQGDSDKAVLKRVLFLYGTSYSQRENCIIGKVGIEIAYSALRQFLTAEELKNKRDTVGIPQTSCFMHRETYINRKIPLNALLSVYVDRVTNLKESIENIEHFAKIHQQAAQYSASEQLLSGMNDSEDKSSLSLNGKSKRKQEQQVDRRRILTQILKNGLNLVVISSIFEEDEALKERFDQSSQHTRLLYNSLNPVYGESYQVSVQMDTKIFDYLKTKRAVFEVRHYILPQSGGGNDRTRTLSNNTGLLASALGNTSRVSDQQKSMGQTTLGGGVDEDDLVMEKYDYITLGYVRVPLLHLITKNNGIDGDFVILDDYKQKMGALKLRIALNHHNTQRPLFSGSTRLPNQLPSSASAPSRDNTADEAGRAALRNATLIDKSVCLNNSFARGTFVGNNSIKVQRSNQEYILALNFVELILRNRSELFDQVKNHFAYDKSSFSSLLYLKFKFLGQNYQTKFIALDSQNETEALQSNFMKQINMLPLSIGKTILLPIDLGNQNEVEQAFACPLEVQLWHKVTARESYKQADKEDLLGSFFVELNELPKTQNTRVKVSSSSEGESTQKFTCYEGYFTMHDFKREKVSQERLGLKLYLIHKEHDQMMSELDQFFHNSSRAEIDHQIRVNLDPLSKGYIEVDDLTNLIEDKEHDKHMANRMACLVADHLEYKNSDSVYYSPLFGLPPPYFKYTKRFDGFGILERVQKELQALDSHEQGFVPLALFRSILEHEVKIKVKIVDDFVQTCKQVKKSLDVNISANSFASHLDYVVLIRKLVLYIETKETRERAEVGYGVEDPNLRLSQTLANQAVKSVETFQACFKIDIESAMRLKNPVNALEPPNAFVKLRVPFEGCLPEESFQTRIVNQSCYPSWHSMDHKLVMPMNDYILKKLAYGERQLEFEVYHVELSDGRSQVQKMIGVAYVDISPLVVANGTNLISGYFHIVDGDQVRSSQQITTISPQHLSKASLGQLKVTITPDTDFQGLLTRSLIAQQQNNSQIGDGLAGPPRTLGQLADVNDNTNAAANLLSPESSSSPYKHSQTFGGNNSLGNQFASQQLASNNYGQVQASQDSFAQFRSSQTGKAFTDTLSKIDSSLQEKNDDELMETHSLNMKALDELHEQLKRTLAVQSVPDSTVTLNTTAPNQYAPAPLSQNEMYEELSDKETSLERETEAVDSPDFKQAPVVDLAGMTMTQKTDEQRQTLTNQLQDFQSQRQQHQPMTTSSVFNPFASKIEEEDDLSEQNSYRAPAENDISEN